MSPRAAECMTNAHAADLAGLATLWGMDHLRVRRADDFDAFAPGAQPVLLEIIPDPEQIGALLGGLGPGRALSIRVMPRPRSGGV